MCDQSTYPFDISMLRLISYKKYNQHFSSYFYVDSWHELANYALYLQSYMIVFYIFVL